MTTADPTAASATPAASASAGRLLREARERQGLHIAALAASIKVPPKKLEALENDRYDELPDATFCRALAQTVCRALKVDAAPVLALLPRSGTHRLEQVSEGLNTPFRERHAARMQLEGSELLKKPAPWIVLLVLLAALAVWLWPSSLSRLADGGRATAASAAVPAASAPLFPPAESGSGVALPREVEVVPAGGAPAAAIAPLAAAADVTASAATTTAAASAIPAGVSSAPASTTGLLVLRTTAPSWVEVIDGRGQPVLSRLLQTGEVVGLDPAPPLRLRIGNAAATELSFRGQPVPLVTYTRDNVARLDLR